MTKKVNKWYSCKCAYTSPYICSYCTNKARAPKWLAIIWKGKLVDIGPGGKIREPKNKKAKDS